MKVDFRFGMPETERRLSGTRCGVRRVSWGQRSGGRASLQPPATLLSPFRAVVCRPDVMHAGQGRSTFSGVGRFRDLGVGCRHVWIPIVCGFPSCVGDQSRMDGHRARMTPTSAFPIIAPSSPGGPTNLEVRRHVRCSRPPSPHRFCFNPHRLAPNRPVPARPPRRGSRR